MTGAVLTAVLVALVGAVLAVSELLRARLFRRPARIPRFAAAATVSVFALAAALVAASSLPGALGMPRRYAAYEPGLPVRPEVFLLLGGAVVASAGLLRAHRSASSAERAGHEVAVIDRTANVVITLSGVGIAVLGLLALVA
jgi:hypothetical protein